MLGGDVSQRVAVVGGAAAAAAGGGGWAPQAQQQPARVPGARALLPGGALDEALRGQLQALPPDEWCVMVPATRAGQPCVPAGCCMATLGAAVQGALGRRGRDGGRGKGEGEGEGEGEGNSPPAPASDDDGCPQCDAPLACLSAACCCACPAQPGGQSPAELAEVAPTAGEACRRRALRMPPPQRPGAVCSALGVVGLLWAAAAAAVLAYRGHQAIGRVGAPAPGLRAIDIDIGVGIGTGIGIEAPPPPPPAASSTAWERATRSAREEEALRERAASSGAARDAGAAGP